MKLSELIRHVGDANVLVETLNSSLVNCKGKSDHSILTLRTDVMKASDWLADTSPYVGMMIWIPKDKLPQTPPVHPDET